MAKTTVIERAEIAVGANTSAFDTAMDALPKKAQAIIQASMEVIQAEMDQAKLQIQLGIGSGQVASVQQLQDYLQKLKAQMDAVRASTINQAQALGDVTVAQGKASAATARGMGGFKNFGYAVLMVSQAVEDLQYGFSAIVNNIPMIAMAMGAGPGVAGAISIASVALNQLIKNWDHLTALFGQGKVKTQAEEMEELRKKTHLTADEAERLARADALPGKVKEIRGGQTEDQKRSEEMVTRAIIEAGPNEVAKGMLAANPEMVDQHGDAVEAKRKYDEARRSVERAKEAAGDSEDPGAIKEAEDRLEAAKRVLADARKKSAEELASTGALPKFFPGGLDRLQKEVAKDPSKFGPKGMQFLNQISGASPEAIKQAKRDQASEGYRAQAKGFLEGQDKDASAEEGLAMSEGQERIEAARKALAKALEEDPYATGKIAAAEEAFKKAIDDQKRRRVDQNKDIEARTEKMNPYLSPEETREKERAREKRFDEAESSDRSTNEELKENRKKRSGVLGAGLQDRYRMEALRDRALGKPVDRAGLEGKVARDLQAKGSSAEDSKGMATVIVEEMMKGIESKVRERSNEKGISTEQASTEEFAKVAGDQMQRAQGGFTGSVEYYQKLQGLQDAKDPYQEAISKNTKDAATYAQQMVNELKKNLRDQGRGGLAGPS